MGTVSALSGATWYREGNRFLDCIVVGDVMMDIVLRSNIPVLSSLKAEGTNYFPESRVITGGSGNLAASMAWLGGKAAFVGKAGDDLFGRLYAQDLETLSVKTRIEVDHDRATGFVVSLVEPAGRRTMLVFRGANDFLAPSEVRNHMAELGNSKFLYVTGYSLLSPTQKDAVFCAASIGRSKGARIVFDPGASNLIRDNTQAFEEMLRCSDIVCANQDEMNIFAEGPDSEEYARLLSTKGKDVIVKLGPDGCLVANDGETHKVPGRRTNCVDTTGAGDAFLGALIYGLSSGLGLTNSATFANWFASKKTEGLGPRYFPSKEECQGMLGSRTQPRIEGATNN